MTNEQCEAICAAIIAAGIMASDEQQLWNAKTDAVMTARELCASLPVAVEVRTSE